MRRTEHPVRLRATAREQDSSLFVALELSKSVWLIAVSAPGSEKVSKYRVCAADVTALLSLLARLKAQTQLPDFGALVSVKAAEILDLGAQ